MNCQRVFEKEPICFSLRHVHTQAGRQAFYCSKDLPQRCQGTQETGPRLTLLGNNIKPGQPSVQFLGNASAWRALLSLWPNQLPSTTASMTVVPRRHHSSFSPAVLKQGLWTSSMGITWEPFTPGLRTTESRGKPSHLCSDEAPGAPTACPKADPAFTIRDSHSVRQWFYTTNRQPHSLIAAANKA